MTAPRDAGTSLDSERALRVFRDAVEQHERTATAVDDLEDPLRQFCRHARRERIPPEQVLVRVKHALESLPAVADAVTERQTARARIISLAIEAYYADRDHDGI